MNNWFDGEMTIGKRAAALGLSLAVWVAFFIQPEYSDGVFSTSKAYFIYALGNGEPVRKMFEQQAAAKEMDWGVPNEAVKEMTRAEMRDPGFQRRMVIYVAIAILIIAGALKLFGYI